MANEDGRRAFIATYRGEKFFTGPRDARWSPTRSECNNFIERHPERDRLRVEEYDNVPQCVIDRGIRPFANHGIAARGAGETDAGKDVQGAGETDA